MDFEDYEMLSYGKQCESALWIADFGDNQKL